MFRWLFGRFAVKPLFREDPYFKLTVDEDPEYELVRVTLTLLGSASTWHGKFKVKSRDEYPLEFQVPGSHTREKEFFLLDQSLSVENRIEVEFQASPLLAGSGRIQFWLERKVGIGGQVAIVGAVFGRGDTEAIQKNKDFNEKNFQRWIEENLDSGDSAGER